MLISYNDFTNAPINSSSPSDGDVFNILKELSDLKLDTTLPSDLQILYSDRCPSFGNIYYCQNSAKNGAVFKYTTEKQTAYRIQCNCCTYDASKVSLISMAHFENLERVDDESQNKLRILPKYSRFCRHHKEMVVFAAIYPKKTVEALIFDAETEKFRKCSCKCEHLQHFRDSHEQGQQQVSFQRSHLDRDGRSLLCLAIDRYDEYEGVMSVFSNGNGDIGRYRYDKENQCFELVKLMEVRVHEAPRMERLKKETPVFFDDELLFYGSQYCPTLQELVFFAYHHDTPTILKLTYTPTFNQFESVNCPCCTFDQSKMPRSFSFLALIDSPSTGGAVALRRLADLKVEKKAKVGGEGWIKIGPSPIRDLEYETEKTFKLRREQESTIKHYKLHILLVDDEFNEYYRLDDNLVVDMAGRIIYSRFTRNLEKIAKPQELLDSHLIPQNVGYCKHRRTVVFSATNTLTPGISNYIFDADKMEVWQIHCCEAKDRKALDQEVLTVANGAEFPVFLKLDEERHLVKQYFDGEAHEFKYLPGEKVVRRFKYEENRRESPKQGLTDLFKNFLSIGSYQKPPAPEPFSLEDLAQDDDKDSDSESTATALELSDVEEDSEDVESTTTALEPSDDLDSDAESTATALEHSDVEEDSEDVTGYPIFYKFNPANAIAMIQKLANMTVYPKSSHLDVHPIPELYERKYRTELRASALKVLDEESFKRIHLDEAGNYADSNSESTATALEPSDSEDDSEDVESTNTALEPSGDEDWDSESAATALEPSDVKEVYICRASTSKDADSEDDEDSTDADSEDSEDDDSDSESTATALEPSGDEEDSEDVESTCTALEHSGDEDEDSESTVATQKPSGDNNLYSEFTSTALKPSETEPKPLIRHFYCPPPSEEYNRLMKIASESVHGGEVQALALEGLARLYMPAELRYPENSDSDSTDTDEDTSEDEDSDVDDTATSSENEDSESTANALEPEDEEIDSSFEIIG